MKKRIIAIALIILVMLNSITFASGFNVPEYIRVGLENYFKEKDSIDINNQILEISSINENEFNNILEIESKSGFAIYTDNHYYVKLNKSIESYEKAIEIIPNLKLDDYQIVPVYVSEGKWMLYIGCYDNKKDMEVNYNLIQQANGNIAVEKIEPNNIRNYITLKDTNKKIIFENQEGYVGFSNPDGPIDLAGKKYRSYIQFVRVASGKITPVNKIKFNEYLYSVVATEMSASWPIEALKAQAIAARNYAVLTLDDKKYKYYDISDTTNDQAYKGFSVEGPNTIAAVEETDGEVLMYDDDVVTAFYFASDGGYTDDSENVWSASLPYLRAVQDIYEKPKTNAWQVEIIKDDIAKLTAAWGKDVGTVKNMYSVNSDKTGRVNQIVITGDKNILIVEKENIRSFFKPFIGTLLKSRNFKILNSGVSQNLFVTGNDQTYNTSDMSRTMYVLGTDGDVNKIDNSLTGKYIANSSGVKQINTQVATDNTFVIQGSGWGHGVGMSQCGARDMAEKGFKYDEILTFYYTGTKVVKN